MCRNCVETAIEHIADTVIRGYEVEIAVRLYRDAVLQHFLLDGAADAKSPEEALADAQALSTIAADAGDALIQARDECPEAYESLLQVRTALSMLQSYANTEENPS